MQLPVFFWNCQLQKLITRHHEGNLPVALRSDLKFGKVCLDISLREITLETFGKKH